MRQLPLRRVNGVIVSDDDQFDSVFNQVRDATRSGYAYMATPYSRFHAGPHAAYLAACRNAAFWLRNGIPVFSPIAHSHPIATVGLLPLTDHDVWMPLDLKMLTPASCLLVVEMPGVNDSYGVQLEIAEADKAGKQIIFVPDHSEL